MAKSKNQKFQEKQALINKITVFFLAVSLIFTSLVSIGILPLKNNPDIHAINMIERVNNTNDQEYKLILYNRGSKFATNVEVRVKFPYNCTIFKIYNNGEELSKKDGIEGNEYSYIYQKIREDEKIYLIIFVENEDFNKTGYNIVIPITYVWCDEQGSIDVSHIESKFIY